MKTYKQFVAELHVNTLRDYEKKATKSAKELSDQADKEKDVLKNVRLRLKSIKRYGNIMRSQRKSDPVIIPFK